ncbi:MAG: preprotein translocase subunit SecE [Pseudomonadota bacterium]
MGRIKRKKTAAVRSHEGKEKKNSEANSDLVPIDEGALTCESKGDDTSKGGLTNVFSKVLTRGEEGFTVGRYPVVVKIRRFLEDVLVEINRITWPSKKETMASTLVVIVLVLVISCFLGIVDIALSSLVGVILK